MTAKSYSLCTSQVGVYLGAAACLLLWPVVPVGAVKNDAATPLRVVTFNLLHDGPTSGFIDNDTHLEARMEMAIRELKALEPDIVTLQEASHSRRHGNVPEQIAKELGFHLVFAPATDRIFHVRPIDSLIVGVMGFKEGEAILSRFPIVGSDIYDLPRCRSRIEPRILLRADLDSPWGPLRVFTTHTAREDECQMERVGEIVREQRGGHPSILTGDFNTLETSKVLTLLRNEAGFIDAFRSANPTVPGATVWQRILSTESTASRRVDFIFLLMGHTSSVTVTSSKVVLDQPGRLPDGTALWPSDHYGVSADLEIQCRSNLDPSPTSPSLSASAGGTFW